jgi:hypothetical protein
VVKSAATQRSERKHAAKVLKEIVWGWDAGYLVHRSMTKRTALMLAIDALQRVPSTQFPQSDGPTVVNDRSEAPQEAEGPSGRKRRGPAFVVDRGPVDSG